MEYRSFTACLPAPGSKCFIVDDGAVRKAEVTMLSARFNPEAGDTEPAYFVHVRVPRHDGVIDNLILAQEGIYSTASGACQQAFHDED